MVRHCAAFGCINSSQKESCRKKGISFHVFPDDKMLLGRWLLNVRRANFQPTRCSLLCSEHFTDDNFVYQPFTNRRQLRKNAIPTQFSYKKGEKRQTMTEEPINGGLLSEKRVRVPDSSDFEFIGSEIDSNEMEANNFALVDASMNERFYSPGQLETLTSSSSESSNSHTKGCDIPVNKIQLKEKLRAKIFLKSLKKQWLDAEIKAATAKRDYYETKKVMLAKLQNDLDLENSSDFQMSAALQNIKVHLKKEELASKIEKKMLKQQLEEAKIVANNCEKEYYVTEFEISSSDDM